MHTLVVVLVPPDTQDVLQKVTDLLAPYKVGKAIGEQIYIEGEELHRLADYAGLPVEDKPHLADYVFEWTKISSGLVDERGLYYRDEGCWDDWTIGGQWDGVVQGKSHLTNGRGGNRSVSKQLRDNICPVGELPKDLDLIAEALMTPDGQWHEGLDYPNAEFGRRQWNKVFWELINEHPDCIAVGIDTHL
jgi:hypothetical protein